MVSPARFERATVRLEGVCSIQLSYEDILAEQLNYNTFLVQFQDFLFNIHIFLIFWN